MVALFAATQFLNALFPTVVTLFCNVIAAALVQFMKALSPTVTRFAPPSMKGSEEQL
jgi:hypothetical protein